MTPPADPERYKNHRFPSEIISHGVWRYYRFPLSYTYCMVLRNFFGGKHLRVR